MKFLLLTFGLFSLCWFILLIVLIESYLAANRGPYIVRTFYYFETSSIPESVNIKTAEFKLTYNYCRPLRKP